MNPRIVASPNVVKPPPKSGVRTGTVLLIIVIILIFVILIVLIVVASRPGNNTSPTALGSSIHPLTLALSQGHSPLTIPFDNAYLAAKNPPGHPNTKYINLMARNGAIHYEDEPTVKYRYDASQNKLLVKSPYTMGLGGREIEVMSTHVIKKTDGTFALVSPHLNLAIDILKN